MSISALTNLLSLFFLTIMCITTPLLAGPSEIAKNHCGAGLADILKMLCKGRYESRQSPNDASRSSDTLDRVSLTAECCASQCRISTLATYCAVKPAPGDLMMAMSSMSSMNDASRSSGPAPPPKMVNAAKTGERPGGRMSELIRSMQTYDVSPLLDTRLESDYESVPYRQRRGIRIRR